MIKLTKAQFCDLANRHEEIKIKRKALEMTKIETYDEPKNIYLKPWTKRK